MPNVGRGGSSYIRIFVSESHFGNKINEFKNSKQRSLIIYIAMHMLSLLEGAQSFKLKS